MLWWQAVILGLLEGLTEFLPVSSTGHLLLAQRLMGIGLESDQARDAADAYAVCIQGGAILAIVSLYANRVRRMSLGLIGQDAQGARLGGKIALAFLPIGVVGLTLADPIQAFLFQPWPIIAGWLIGGVVLIMIHLRRWGFSQEQNAADTDAAPPSAADELASLTWRAALIIGLMQCLALWPGTSRALVTLVGGLMVGLSLRGSLEFSFLLGAITLLGATAVMVLKHGQDMVELYGPLELLLGFVVSYLAAAASVKWLLSFVDRYGLAVLGGYRIAVGLVAAGWVLILGPTL